MSDRGEDRLAALLDSVESMASAMRAVSRPPPAVMDSSDTTGAVTVTLEDHGRKVTRVVVAADWQKAIAADALGDAVLEAVLRAQFEPARDFLTAATDAPPATPQPPSPPPVVRDPAATLDWDDLGHMFETVQRAMDALLTPQAAARDGATSTPPAVAGVAGHSENRRVTVSLAGDRPTAVTVDPEWARRTNRQQLCASLNEAFSAAYAAASPSPTEPAPAADLVGPLQEIMDRIGLDPRLRPPEGYR